MSYLKAHTSLTEKRWMAKLLAHLLATPALWVRIQSRKQKSRYGSRNRLQERDNPMPTWFLAPIAGLNYRLRHLSTIQNGRHKQRSGQHTLVRKKKLFFIYSLINKHLTKVCPTAVDHRRPAAGRWERRQERREQQTPNRRRRAEDRHSAVRAAARKQEAAAAAVVASSDISSLFRICKS